MSSVELDGRTGNRGRAVLGGAFVVTTVFAATLLGAGSASAAPSSLTDCPLLLEGQSSDCVALLQAALNDVNESYDLVEDGSFGVDTRIALLDFQGRNHLPVDGNAGSITLYELAMQTETVSSPTAGPPAVPPVPAIASTITDSEVCDAVGLVPDGVGGCVSRDSGAATSLGRPIGECVAEQFKSDLLKEARKQRGILGKSVGVSKGLLKDVFKKAGAVVTIPKCHLWDTDE